MNRDELIAEVANRTDMTKRDVADVLSEIIESIQKAVAKGKKVSLVGFGSFEPRKRAARMGRNPQTGKSLKIAAKTVPAFVAGKSFKDRVAKKK